MLLYIDWSKQCAHFGRTFPLTKRQMEKYIKHEKEKTLSGMSLLEIAVEKLPPSQRNVNIHDEHF